jgi:hypothetical protein
VACGLLGTGVVAIWPGPKEPEYHGKKLSEWLGRNMRPNGDTTDAVCAMGTNALPQLVSWLDYERPSWQYELMRTGWKISPRLWNKFYGDDLKTVRMNNAVWAFIILGARAAPAVPGLVHIMKTGRANSAATAAYVLGGLGEEAVPVLLEILTNRQSFPKLTPGTVTSMIRGPLTNGAVLVPVLVPYLTNPNPKLRASAAQMLGKLRAEPDTVVPRLADLVHDEDGYTQYRAIEALQGFATNARPVVPALLPLLSDSDRGVRDAATNALSAIAPEVLLMK